MVKQLIICADDFAQNAEISDGILILARDKRINAISCMVNDSSWRDASQDLLGTSYNGYVGLHLNFTFGQPLSSVWRKNEGEKFYSLPTLIKKLYLGKIQKTTLEAEIQAQIDVFANAMHIYPDFLDGHQHVHQLPGLREALLHVYTKIKSHTAGEENDVDEHEYSDSFFRNTSNGHKDFWTISGFPKLQVLSILGGRKFKKLLTIKQIPTNASFAGVYNFKNARNYRKYFQKFLNQTQNGGIIMCHPGSYSQDSSDPLHKYRYHELTYFMSDLFLTDMEDNNYSLIMKKT